MKRNKEICIQCKHKTKWFCYPQASEGEWFCNRNYRYFDHMVFRNWHKMDVPPSCPFRMEHQIIEWNKDEKES